MSRLFKLPNGDWIDPAAISGIRYQAEQKMSGDFFAPSVIVIDRYDGGDPHRILGLDPELAHRVVDQLAEAANQVNRQEE